MKINIETIPHNEHRYSTTGDYFLDGDILKVRVSHMPDEKYEQLVLIHELVEMFLCKARGISMDDVDKWDIEHPELEEPGDDSNAPYHKEHYFATIIEKMLCLEMGVSWEVYNQIMDNLYK